jgi:hypothetical protein
MSMGSRCKGIMGCETNGLLVISSGEMRLGVLFDEI